MLKPIESLKNTKRHLNINNLLNINRKFLYLMVGMKKNFLQHLVTFVAFIYITFPFDALAGARTYDISILLYQPHPLSELIQNKNLTLEKNKPIPANQIRMPARIPEIKNSSRTKSRPAIHPSRLLGNPNSTSERMEEKSKFNIISEIRVGLLAHDHDLAPFSRSEENGIDTNFEILFKSPDWSKNIGSPRPHLGFSLNLSGDTSQLYTGLTWEWMLADNWFLNFSLGGSAHNGKTTTTLIDRKELGCKVLFRESIEVGYILKQRHSVSAFFDHISNAKLCDKNEGLETIGLRYGYRF